MRHKCAFSCVFAGRLDIILTSHIVLCFFTRVKGGDSLLMGDGLLPNLVNPVAASAVVFFDEIVSNGAVLHAIPANLRNSSCSSSDSVTV